MARFRNTLNGVVVDVDDDTAGRLGAAYESADEQKQTRGTSTRKRTVKSDDD